MNVPCPECQSVFRVDPAKVPASGVRARCSVCGGVIAVAAGSSIDEEFAPARPSAEPRVERVARGATVTPASPPAYEPPTVPFHAMPSVASAPGATSPLPAEGAEQAIPAEPSAPLAPPPPTPRSTTAPRGVPVTPPVASPRVRPTPATGVESTPATATPGRPMPAAPTRPTMFPPRPAATPSVAAAGMPSPAAPRSPVPPPRVTLPPIPPVPAPPRPSLAAAMTPPVPVPPSVARPVAPIPPAPVAPSAPQPATRPAPGAPVAGAPTRAPINPFLANDPNAKARRLSRALVSDLVTYFPQRRDEGLREGTLRELFREEIKKSYEEYTDQVGREFAESTTHFQEALNDILASGQKLF